MSSILIKDASVIATMDEERRVHKNQSILIRDNIIEKFCGPDEPADEIIDAAGKTVIPGLINTHHHLYQTLTRNLPQVQDAKLFDWLKFLYEIWRNIDEEAVDISTRIGVGELLLTGCTTTSDHLYVFPEEQGDFLMDTEIKAAAEMGIRFHPTRGSMSLGRSSGGLPPDSVIQEDSKILKESERVIDMYHDPERFAMCRVVLAPCSPFSVTEDIMVRSAELARDRGVFLHTHLAETKDEEEFCINQKGMRPLAYMEKVGWTGEDVWFAHCVHVNDSEIAKLAETSSGVAHCPTSNLRLGSGIAPVRRMLDRGVRVSLAVDGSASNDSSDMLGELRIAMLAARFKSGVDSMGAADVLKMATLGGADVLGRSEIGRIEPGMAADIALFDMQRIDYAGTDSDPVGALIFAGACHRADTVIVNGKIRVKDSRLVGIDEEELTDSANRVSRKLRERAGIETD